MLSTAKTAGDKKAAIRAAATGVKRPLRVGSSAEKGIAGYFIIQ
ncbi:hypothetical protein yinte0001_36890 [Yersinia intermedia ATCC 29909]|nr:hypothetical protein yinte0001_36890 [Yersinia intermedia ATCC 29909]